MVLGDILSLLCSYIISTVFGSMLGVPVCDNCARGYCTQSRQDNIAEAHFIARVEHSSKHWPASLWTRYVNSNLTCEPHALFIHFTSASVAVACSQLNASSSTLCSDCNLPSYFVNRHMLTMWLMVGYCLHSQTADLAMPYLIYADFLDMDYDLSIKWLSRDHVLWGRLKAGCHVVIGRVSYNSVVEDYRSREPVFPPLCSYINMCQWHVWPRTVEVAGRE